MTLDYLRNNYQLKEQNTSVPEKTITPNARGSNVFKVFILAGLIVVTLIFSFKLWKPTLKKAFGSSLQFGSLKVTGVMIDDKDPMAVVDGKVVHKGDIISGYTVCEIGYDAVEFSKNGKTRCEKLQPRTAQVKK